MNSRAQAGGGTASPVDPTSVFARAWAAARYVVSGKTDWFGPREPLPAVAPDEVRGRALDYQTGANLNITPRANEPISFHQLRTFADQYDILRLIIETRKDQIAKLSWVIRPREKEQKPDSRCKAIQRLFHFPDGEHDWDTWLRALMEDMLVIDAATLYPLKRKSGQPWGFEVVDGSTIKRVIGFDGRTPEVGVAYQQVLKGLPAADFTRDELVYRPRNWRVHKFYGFSPVEQVLMTVNIALRRQITQLAYYTEGNVPEALIGVPNNWTTEQIKQFQRFWDDLMAGELTQKRRARFVPGDMKYQPTREPIIKDQYDEWLARVVCFAFSISPQPFVMMMNRSTAETAHAAALEEGLAPIMQWVKNLVDYLLMKYLDADDLEFAWDDQQQLDKVAQANVHKIYIDGKVMTPDEVREDIGKEPMTPEQRAKAFPEPVVPGDGGGGPPGKSGKPGAQGKAGEKGEDDDAKAKGDGAYLGKRATRPFAVARRSINRDRRAAVRAYKALRKATDAALGGIRDRAVALCEATAKADSDLLRALRTLEFGEFDTLVTDVEGVFEELAKDGGVQALAQVGMLADGAALDLVNERAVAWAKSHAAELVGKKWVKGELVDNPNARWRIDEKTREGINSLVDQAEHGGWSNDRLANELRDAYAFSDERAEMIARTETAKADMAGNMIAYEEAGVERKRWLVAQSEACPVCEENGQAGVIAMGAAFPSGAQHAPAHPRCRCDVLPVLDDEE